MKNIKDYINESSEDRKNGHWEDFVDEDTGEIVSMWVKDKNPELEKLKWDIYQKYHEEVRKLYNKCLAADKENLKKREKLEDTLWDYEQDLKDTNRQYRQLQIDQEDELGQLYSSGKEAEAEEKAQEYGEQFNELADKIESLKSKIKKIQPQIAKLEAESEKIWEPYYKADEEDMKKYNELMED